MRLSTSVRFNLQKLTRAGLCSKCARLFDFNGNHPRFSTAANLMLRNSTVHSVDTNVQCARSPPVRPLPPGVRSSFVTPDPVFGRCCLRSALCNYWRRVRILIFPPLFSSFSGKWAINYCAVSLFADIRGARLFVHATCTDRVKYYIRVHARPEDWKKKRTCKQQPRHACFVWLIFFRLYYYWLCSLES